MELPLDYKYKLESLLEGYSLKTLKECAFKISENYQNGFVGENHIKDDLSAKVYAVMRYPATFKAFSKALEDSLRYFDGEIKSIIDVGAGSGAATLACALNIKLVKATLLEIEQSMIDIGKFLFEDERVQYQKIDITKDLFEERVDMVISSYVLNELVDVGRLNCLNKMWDMADKMILIVEPGTPKGSALIKQVRDYYISLGGHVLAPCPHMNACNYDWCHFSTRVARSKLHKDLKGGDAPYEDEKFSYIAISKEPCSKCSSRVLRHPLINSGFVDLEVCTQEGIKKIKITKKDKEKFKAARKANCGDEI